MSTDEWERVVRDITAAHERAVAMVRATPGALAFQRATALRNEMEAMADTDADLRAEVAARISREESLTLQGLADAIDLSLPRAQQLRNRGRRVEALRQE